MSELPLLQMTAFYISDELKADEVYTLKVIAIVPANRLLLYIIVITTNILKNDL